jgi:peptidoglycan hydrolase-like protein with peptidoglycan-binding domain
VPSTTQDTSAGEEVQCLLKRAGFDPGTVDGVFGPHSQAAARAFQTAMNNKYGAELVGSDCRMPSGGPETVLNIEQSYVSSFKGKTADLGKTYTNEFAVTASRA